MPELPDVEGFKAVLAEHATGRRIEDVTTPDPSVIMEPGANRFRKGLRGRRLDTPVRHGKWLLAPIADARTKHPPVVMMHFGMTGGLVWCEPDEERHRHDRVVFDFSSGQLRFRDMRKLKGLRLVDDARAEELLADVGPDAAQLSRADLAGLLIGSRGQLKSTLMDQSVLAGLGNLLSDEVLWRARLHPRARASDLSDAEVRRLHSALRSTVRSSAKAGRVPDRRSWLTGRRDDEEAECPRCGSRLASGRIGGRHALWCPRCQAS